MNKIFFLLTFTFLSFCQKIDPKIEFSIHEKFIQDLNSPFGPLTNEENQLPFSQEFRIAKKFAQELDLYQAIQCFKRAKFLLADHQSLREYEIHYNILLCYYFAKRYADVIETFENEPTILQNNTFSTYEDVLCILFESLNKEKKYEKANEVLETLTKICTKKGSLLKLSNAFSQADLHKINTLCEKNTVFTTLDTFFKNFKQDSSEEQKQDMLLYLQNPESVCLKSLQCSLNQEQTSALTHLSGYNKIHKESTDLIKTYKLSHKSSTLAGALNIIPGLGYLYLGQKQSAFTAFCLNSLFIGSAWHFYKVGNIPAALITLSFESGWFAGGILGAKENAKLYNERLYETLITNHMKRHNLFPITMLSYGF